MAIVQFHKVTTLPGTLEPDALYFVESGTVAESYLTNSSGVARALGNTARTNTLITAALAGLNTLEIVADITARDALNTVNHNFLVLVIDATADTSVTAGAALYAFRNSDNAFFKVAEYESLDVVVSWASITGKPTSSPAAIDAAVADSHTHANAAVLDDLSDISGALAYNGVVVSSSWDTLAW